MDVSLEIGIEMPFEIRRISSPTNKIFIKVWSSLLAYYVLEQFRTKASDS